MDKHESGVVSNDSLRDQRAAVMPYVLPPQDSKSLPASKTMGKNMWTAGALLRYIEARIKNETDKFLRLGS